MIDNICGNCGHDKKFHDTNLTAGDFLYICSIIDCYCEKFVPSNQSSELNERRTGRTIYDKSPDLKPTTRDTQSQGRQNRQRISESLSPDTLRGFNLSDCLRCNDGTNKEHIRDVKEFIHLLTSGIENEIKEAKKHKGSNAEQSILVMGMILSYIKKHAGEDLI